MNQPMEQSREAGVSRTTALRLAGLDCADCAAKLEKRLARLPGVEKVQVNFGASRMTMQHTAPVEEVLRVVEEAGYQATLAGAPQRRAEGAFWVQNGRLLLTVFSGFLLALAWVTERTTGGTWAVSLYLLSMLSGGYYVGRAGLYAVRRLSLDMNFLMTVAAVGAVAIGEWTEGASVVFLFSLGNTLQAYSMDRTRRSIRALMDLSPRTALVKREGRAVALPVEEVRVGEVVVVRPGEQIPLDGVVSAGVSAANQAPITGESIPVDKEPGDEVFAGSINGQGVLEVSVTRLSEDSTLSRIIHLVEEAQGSKAPAQQFVDVFARYYTPAVIVLAAGLAVIPPLLGQPAGHWFYLALVLLVISCPCALVISTPVAIVSAVGNAARHGVLVKGGAALEAAGALRVMALDKTGTLTAGRPEVTDVRPLEGQSERELLATAAALEAHSGHPLGEAILRLAEEQQIPALPAGDFLSLTGRGVRGAVEGSIHYLGSPRLFAEMGVQEDGLRETLAELAAQGKTVLLLGTEAKVLGLFALADRPRENARAALQGLRGAGIRRTVLLTGDNESTGRAIAEELGLDGYRAGLLPEDKLASIQELRREYGPLAMVGDGVNDAPALAAASVGIAMGVAGTDTALETADITLMGDDLTRLPYVMRLSRSTLSVIKQNIAFSLLVKGAFLALALLGLANLWMAVFADTGAALLVILNGMRLLRLRPAEA